MGFLKTRSTTLTPMDSVRASAKAVLQTFIDERLERYPESEELFTQAVVNLVWRHKACETVLEHMRETPGLYAPILDSMATSPYRTIQRVFCAFHHVAIHVRCMNSMEKYRGWFYLLTEGACDIYSQPFSVFENYLVAFNSNLEKETNNKPIQMPLRSMRLAMSSVCQDLQCESLDEITSFTLVPILMTSIDEFHEKLNNERAAQLIIEKEW